MIGAAVQLCTLPWFGFVPDDDVGAAPAAAVDRLAGRLEIRAVESWQADPDGHDDALAAFLGPLR